MRIEWGVEEIIAHRVAKTGFRNIRILAVTLKLQVVVNQELSQTLPEEVGEAMLYFTDNCSNEEFLQVMPLNNMPTLHNEAASLANSFSYLEKFELNVERFEAIGLEKFVGAQLLMESVVEFVGACYAKWENKCDYLYFSTAAEAVIQPFKENLNFTLSNKKFGVHSNIEVVYPLVN